MDIDISALKGLTRERGLSLDYVVESIEQALTVAYQHSADATPNARVQLDRATGHIQVFAKELDEEGNVLGEFEVMPKDFSRVAASIARGEISQRLKAADDDVTVAKYLAKEGDIVAGVIQQGGDRNLVFIQLDGLDGVEGVLPPEERVPDEDYSHGIRIRCFVVSVKKGPRGPLITLSRSHPKFVEALFKFHVPEIDDGTVTIEGIAREAGRRTKVAVATTTPGINPKGSCIGTGYQRVKSVMTELNGEKIDIVDYSEDIAEYVAHALSPAEVISAKLVDSDLREVRVVVPDYKKSLAIGRDGQNVRLAARLTGAKIDIVSDTEIP